MRKTYLRPFSGQWFSSFMTDILMNAAKEPGTPKYPVVHTGRFIFGLDADSFFLSNKKTRTERHPRIINKILVSTQRFYSKAPIQQREGFIKTDNFHVSKKNDMQIIKAFFESTSREGT